MKPDGIIDRIRKLLRLAEGTANANEAAAAAAQAQRLMTKHRLSREDVQERDDFQCHDPPLFRGKHVPMWILALGTGVARNNGCTCLTITEGGKRRFVVVGREEDCLMVAALFGYLRKEIDRLGREARRRGYLHSSSQVRQFRLGAVMSVCMALDSARDQASRGAPSGAIVRANQDAARALRWAKKELGAETGKTRRLPKEVGDAEARAFGMGRVVGEHISVIDPKKTMEE